MLRPLLETPFEHNQDEAGLERFGHSLAAFIAFELTRQLREHDGPRPVQLLVAGQRALQSRGPCPPIFELPDADFLDEVARRDNAVPQGPALLNTPADEPIDEVWHSQAQLHRRAP